jgi:hypothetical protein
LAQDNAPKDNTDLVCDVDSFENLTYNVQYGKVLAKLILEEFNQFSAGKIPDDAGVEYKGIAQNNHNYAPFKLCVEIC